MATKKKKRAADVRAKKRKKGFRFFLLAVFSVLGIASLALLFFTLSDFLDVADSDRPEGVKKKARQTVTLYFSDVDEVVLAREKRIVPKPASRELQAQEIVKALIEGPKSDLIRTLPEETGLLSVKIKNGTAVVDFDSGLVDRHPGGSASEIATIYSLTNTLIANLPEIKSVKILVEGKVRETLKGHMDTTKAFTFNQDLIRADSRE